MADQSGDHQMEGVEAPTGAVDKGKGKAPQVPQGMEESGEEDSSDESGAEEQVSPIRRPEVPPAQKANIIATGRRRYDAPYFCVIVSRYHIDISYRRACR